MNRNVTASGTSKKNKAGEGSQPNIHPYPSIESGNDLVDDAAHQRNCKILKQEVMKPKPRQDVLKNLMQQTFYKRRQWILEVVTPVNEICEQFPLLKKSCYVS